LHSLGNFREEAAVLEGGREALTWQVKDTRVRSLVCDVEEVLDDPTLEPRERETQIDLRRGRCIGKGIVEWPCGRGNVRDNEPVCLDTSPLNLAERSLLREGVKNE
jgi:hypothetical protein